MLHKDANWARFYIDELKVEEITTAVPKIEYVEHYYKAGEYTAKLFEAETEILAINLSWEGSGKVYVSEDNVSWEEVGNGIEKSVEWKAVYCKVALTTPAVNTTPSLWNLKASLKSGGTLRVWENNTTAEIYTQEGKPLYGLARGFFAGRELIGIRNYNGWIYLAEKNNTTWNVSKVRETNGSWKMGFDFVVWEGKQYYFWADNGSGNYQVYGMLGNTTVLFSTSHTDAIDVHAIAPGTEQLPFRMPKTEKKLHVVWRDYDDWYSMLWYASFDAELTQTGASQRIKLDTNYTELVMDRQGHPLLGLFEPAIATGYFGEVYIAFSRYGIERGIGMATNYEEPDKVVETMQTTIDSLPDEVFDRNPEERKQALNNKLEAIENMLEANNTKGAVQKMKTEVMPKVSGGEGSWIQGSDATGDLVDACEQMITSTKDKTGESTVWLSCDVHTPKEVAFSWGCDFPPYLAILYWRVKGTSTWPYSTEITSSYAVITVSPSTTYEAKVVAQGKSGSYTSNIVEFSTTFALKRTWKESLLNGKVKVWWEANMWIGYGLCIWYPSGSSVTGSLYSSKVMYAIIPADGAFTEGSTYSYRIYARTTENTQSFLTSYYSFVYVSPQITQITWIPSHDSTSSWYECAKIVWQTNVAASGSMVSFANINKVVTATTSSDGKTHTAWVTGLSPSTTYSFTVSSIYSGATLIASGNGKTRMRITGWEIYDIAYSGKVYFRIKWSTTETPVGNNKVKYTFSDGTSGEKNGAQYPNSVNKWFADIENVNRAKMGIGVSFTVYASSSMGDESRCGSGVAYKDSDYSQSYANLRDGLFDCEEGITSPYSVDSDMDGLVDGWRDADGDHRYDENEVPGEIGNPGGSYYTIWEDGKKYTIYSGSIFYECVLCFGYIPGSMKELPDPLKKDIYVEVDGMQPKDIYVQVGWWGYWVRVCDGHMILPTTKEIIVSYFASHNVRVHIDDGCLGGGELISHEDTTKIGKIPYEGRYNLKRKHAFVYCLFCHDSDGHLGHANATSMTVGDANWHKSIPDILWLLGAPGWAIYYFVKGDSQTCQAGVFMHELGHVLGLYPGELMGNGNGWGPPTHHSCMNYLYILHDTWYTESEWNTIYQHLPTYLGG